MHYGLTMRRMTISGIGWKCHDVYYGENKPSEKTQMRKLSKQYILKHLLHVSLRSWGVGPVEANYGTQNHAISNVWLGVQIWYNFRENEMLV